ncbi:hypothetical protein QQ045_030237 [Rhodiola kirilowii]
MAEEITPRGNDWEVVSLTASAYASAPGPIPVEEIVGDEGSVYGEDKVEASQAMFMSGHFVPEKQPKDMPIESEVDHSQVPVGHKFDELASLETSDEIGGWVDNDDGIKGLAITDDNLETKVIGGQGSATGTGSAEVQRSMVEPDQSIYDSAEETIVVGASSSDVKTMLPELTGPSEEATADRPADDTSTKKLKDKNKARSGVPCGPWWRRQAVSLYDHVKDVNPLWSIVIAAAVMGLAVIGKRWQQQKSQVSQLNLQLFPKEEKSSKVLGPISRLKEAFVNGDHGSPSVRNNFSGEI